MSLFSPHDCLSPVNDGQQQLPAKTVFAHLQPGQKEILSSRRWGGRDARMRFGHFSRPFWGRLVDVSALRLEDGELLILISPDSPESAISDYANCWGIETLFDYLRSVVNDLDIKFRQFLECLQFLSCT